MEGLFAVLFIILGLAALGIFILLIVAEYRLYEKMGEPGWKSIIPIYRFYVLYKRVWNIRAAKTAAVIAAYSTVMIFVNSYTENFINPNELSLSVSLILIFMVMLNIPNTIVSLIMSAIVCNKESEAFGRGIGTTLGLIFLPFVFIPILAYGSAQYKAPQ